MVENDRFVLPIPDSLPQTGQICLEIGGNRIGSTPGVLEQVSYGRVCGVSLPGWITTPPPEMNDDLVYVPIFGGDQPPDRTLDHSIVAHVDMRDAGDLPPGARTHSLIHFSDDASPTALEIVAEAMRRRKPNGAAISVMLVLPSGSLAATRDPISGRIHAFSREFSSPVAVTEDYEGGWTRALNVAARPSTSCDQPPRSASLAPTWSARCRFTDRGAQQAFARRRTTPLTPVTPGRAVRRAGTRLSLRV